jgi:hypothetical protein
MKYDPIEQARLIYEAQPTAYNASAYQLAIQLAALKTELEQNLNAAKEDRKAAKAELAFSKRMADRFRWQSIGTAPMDCPILASWVTDHGRRVTGLVWKQLEFPSVDSDMEEAMGMPKMMGAWSFDYEGEDLLHYEPTHWMDVPEFQEEPVGDAP